MEREAKHLATKEDVFAVKEDISAVREDMALLEVRLIDRMDSKFQTMFYWSVGLFVTMLLGFIATLFTLIQM